MKTKNVKAIEVKNEANNNIKKYELQKRNAQKIEIYYKWYINQEYNEIDNALNTLQKLLTNKNTN